GRHFDQECAHLTQREANETNTTYRWVINRCREGRKIQNRERHRRSEIKAFKLVEDEIKATGQISWRAKVLADLFPSIQDFLAAYASKSLDGRKTDVSNDVDSQNNPRPD